MSDAMHDTTHFQDSSSPSLITLADVTLKTADTTFPAHSQILALHSKFVAELLAETHVDTPRQSLIIDTALQRHRSDTVRAWLTAIYNGKELCFESMKAAWEMCMLVDQFDCPSFLLQCKGYAQRYFETPQAETSEAVRWIDLADRLDFTEVKDLCARQVAADRNNLPDLIQEVSNKALHLIIAQLHNVVKKQSDELSKAPERGRVLQVKQFDRGLFVGTRYSFRCDDLSCQGHRIIVRQHASQHGYRIMATVKATGSYHCSHEQWTLCKDLQLSNGDADFTAVLPQYLVDILKRFDLVITSESDPRDYA